MKRPVAKISNHSRRLATFASDVIDHSRRLAKVANLRFALLCVQSKRTFTLRVRLDWTRSNAKQPKFDVIDSSRKVETGSQPFASCRWRQILVASRCFASSLNAPLLVLLLRKFKNQTPFFCSDIHNIGYRKSFFSRNHKEGFEAKAGRFSRLRTNNVLVANSSISLVNNAPIAYSRLSA